MELSSGVTTFLGRNGQGKTNLVEAVGFLATLGSHRAASDAPLVRHGASTAAVGAAVRTGERSMSVQVQITPGRSNRAWVNRSPLPRAREVLGLVRVVVFAPEDLALVKGDPGGRRRFLDELLALRTPRLAGVRADYERVLRQRTALLRDAAGGRGRSDLVESTLEVWDDQLVTHGSELLAARARLVSELRVVVDQAYQRLAPAAAPAQLAYRSSAGGVSADQAGGGSPAPEPTGVISSQQWAASMREALRARRREELARGVCLVGPHRDDMEIMLGPLPARGYASQGESWSLALALRLGSFDLLAADASAGPPVLVLDDVLAELDDRRRGALVAAVQQADQVLVTAAVRADVPEGLLGSVVAVPDDVLAPQGPADEPAGSTIRDSSAPREGCEGVVKE